MATSVRFLNNFIMTVVQTTLDNSGELSVSELKVHVSVGDVYTISSYQKLPDDKVTIEFPDDSNTPGVAERIESDYCEINTPRARPPALAGTTSGGGCGGCGKKKG